MFEFFLAAAAEEKPDLTWLSGAFGAVAGIIVSGITAWSVVWRRRQDRKDQVEDKKVDAELSIQPKVVDIYEEVRVARAEATTYYGLYRAFEDLYYTVMSALRHLARRVRAAHPEQEFDKDIVDALASVPPNTADDKK